jgi:hypothetical protein
MYPQAHRHCEMILSWWWWWYAFALKACVTTMMMVWLVILALMSWEAGKL